MNFSCPKRFVRSDHAGDPQVAACGISIPSSVTSIGGHAFEGCSGLTSITLPNSKIKWGEKVFSQKIKTIVFEGSKEEWEALKIDFLKYDSIKFTR